MNDPANNAAAVVAAMGGGMSTRSQAWAHAGATSKSAASRYWIRASAAKVVELRFFGGLSVKETAAVLEISEESVARVWRLARAWLAREIGKE